MDRLIRTVKAEDQDRDLFCDCHGGAPVARLYVIEDENGARADVCLVTFLELKSKECIRPEDATPDAAEAPELERSA